MLEEQLKRIADSLEQLVQLYGTPNVNTETVELSKTRAKTKKVSGVISINEAEVLSENVAFTEDDVKEALKELLSARGAEEAKKLLAKFGASKLSQIPRDKYQEVIGEMKRVSNAK